MATVSINPKWEEEVGVITKQLQRGGVRLSDYASGLLSFMVEGWFEEPPAFRRGIFNTELERFNLAKAIAVAVLKDPHISEKLKLAGGRVELFDLLPALSDSGKEVLREFLEKGI